MPGSNPTRPEKPLVWRFGLDPIDYHFYASRIVPSHIHTGIINEQEYAGHEYQIAKTYGVVECSRYPFPDDMPPLVFHFPSRDGFLPDLLSPSSLYLCSARLRNAMALPSDVIQYLPLKIQAPDSRIHAMSYKVMRVLACQPAVDLVRSDVKVEEAIDPHIGDTYCRVTFKRRLALLADLRAQTELFHAAELGIDIFATDGLAERVMQAGCLGVCFEHPEEPYFWDRPRTIRTARGVEKAGPAARRAHLRRVKQVRGLSSNEPAYHPGPGSPT